MYSLLGALDYDENDQDVQLGSNITPELQFGANWMAVWAVLFLIGWMAINLSLSRKHQQVQVYV